MNTGAFGENFPYSNFHDLNMDWIIKIAKDFLDQYTHIQETIQTGLDDLDAKKNELEALLQEWYDTHSEDIANQLASALEDLNDWYTEHQNYLNQTLQTNITAFDTHAEQKAAETIASIPADYTELSTNVDDIETAVKGLTQEYCNAIPMTANVYQNRIKVLDAFYNVTNGYINRCIILKILTDAITTAGSWTLGELLPDVNLKTGDQSIDYTARSLTGDSISGMTFRQTAGNPQLINNFTLESTGAITPGQGGIIMLTHSQAMNGTSNAIPDTEYPSKLINDTQESKDLFNTDFTADGYAWRRSTNRIESFENYSYIMIRVQEESSILVKGLTETLSSLGYAILDSSRTILTSGGEWPAMIIDIPVNGYWLVFSYPTNANIMLIPYYKKKVVVLGDSWCDNDPSHTEYTKWTTLLQRDGRYSVKVYAQNGSFVTGDTPDYGLNGNIAGQMEQLKTDNPADIDIFIIMAGINDFRNNVSQNSVASKLNEFYSTLNWLYPKSRIIYIANNQVFITMEQLKYFHGIIDYLRAINGIEAFTSFGWVLPNHYTADNVHVDDYGYKDIYANIISILNGGQVVSCKVEHEFIMYDSDTQNCGTMTMEEQWVNGYPQYSAKLSMFSTGYGKIITKTINTTDNVLLASVPFAKTLIKWGTTSITAPVSLMTCTVADSFATEHKLNTTNTFTIALSTDNSGAYYTENCTLALPVIRST